MDKHTVKKTILSITILVSFLVCFLSLSVLLGYDNGEKIQSASPVNLENFSYMPQNQIACFVPYTCKVYYTIWERASLEKAKPLTPIELDIVELAESKSKNIDIIEPSYIWVSLGYYTLLAYCPCVLCCGIWSAEHPSRIGTDFVQRTASGTIPTAGRTIAVNPAIIPYGTQVKINGHIYIAEDTGAAMRRARIIDIFHDCHEEAIVFGRRRAEIFVKAYVTETMKGFKDGC